MPFSEIGKEALLSCIFFKDLPDFLCLHHHFIGARWLAVSNNGASQRETTDSCGVEWSGNGNTFFQGCGQIKT
jgi:hypothetical protein